MSDRQILRLAIALFLCRAAIGALVIPPWQGPDEPPHYVVAEQVATGTLGDASTRARLEQEVLQSMAFHDWWRGYRMATPDPVPTRFAQEPEHLGSGNIVQPVYYLVAGSILRACGLTRVDSRYFLLRFISVMFGVATILMAWAGTRLLFDALTASMIAMLAALHPQFMLSASTVSPEPLANALGALVWWQGARFIVSGEVSPALIATGASIVAVLTKRNAVPILGAAAVLIGIGLHRRTAWSRRSAFLLLAGCAAIACVGWFVWTSSAEPIVQLRAGWYATLFQFHASRIISVSRAANFTVGLIDSSWLVGGWLRFPAPDWWLQVTRVLTIGSFLGALVAFIRRPTTRMPLGVSAAIAAFFLLAVITNGLLTDTAPQGRYMFVAVTPFAVLLWIGYAEWWPPGWRWLAAPTIVSLMLALDVSGWITTLLPAYV